MVDSKDSTKTGGKHLAGGIGNEGDNADQIFAELQKELKTLSEKPLTIVIFGASGHLARTKVIPSFYKLYTRGLIPESFTLLGYSRSKLSDSDFHSKLKPHLSGDALAASAEQLTPSMVSHHSDDESDEKSTVQSATDAAKDKISDLTSAVSEKLQLNPATQQLNIQKFLARCHYLPGQYDKTEDIQKLDKRIKEVEADKGGNRIFYLAIPPEIFGEVASEIKKNAMAKDGFTRLVVEKPFGKNRKEAKELNDKIAESFSQDQIFRVDHFLGKELIQQIPLLRFTNTMLEPIWNNKYVAGILINFKETAGVEGRGGYFDDYGMIRDVVQNHLLNALAFATMEPPSSFTKQEIQKKKAAVMYSAEPIKPENCVIGQYSAGKDPETGKPQPSYREDPTTKDDSIAHTYCCQAIFVNNERWKGVPMIINAGKAMNSAASTITVQWKQTSLTKQLFETAKRDELCFDVLRSNIAFRMNIKAPGLTESPYQTEFDILPQTAAHMAQTPAAYERVLLDVLRGDNSLFVSAEEQDAMWHVVEDVLEHIEKNKVEPEMYPFGSGGPKKAAELINKFDIQWTGDLETLQ